MIILDRFEGEIAVLETDGSRQEIPRQLLPDMIKEGDVLIQVQNGYQVDTAATEARRSAMAARTKSLHRQNKF